MGKKDKHDPIAILILVIIFFYIVRGVVETSPDFGKYGWFLLGAFVTGAGYYLKNQFWK